MNPNTQNSPLMNHLIEKAKTVGGTFYKITLIEKGISETAIITPAKVRKTVIRLPKHSP